MAAVTDIGCVPKPLFRRDERVALSPRCARCRAWGNEGWHEVRIFDHTFNDGKFAYEVRDALNHTIEVCEECLCTGLLGHEGPIGGRCRFCGQAIPR